MLTKFPNLKSDTTLDRVLFYPCRDIKSVNAALVERITPSHEVSQEYLLKIQPCILFVPNVGRNGELTFRQFCIGKMTEE